MAESGFTSMAGPKAEGTAPEVGIGMLGYAFMGKAHSNAYKTIPYMMYPPPAIPKLVAICGRNEAAAAEAARRYGYEGYYTDWHKMLPNEDWLSSFCKAEKQQGRKVLVYVRQTGTRDIQDRVQMPMQSAGLRVAILGGNLDPRKREGWIAKRVSTIDALICNPRL